MASNQATNVDERATQVSLLSPAPSLVRRDSYLDTGTLLGHDRNYISLLLVPAGVAFGALGCPPVLIFLVNFLALIPLTLLVMEMVIHLSYHAGSAKGGLLRAILGNAVELLTGIVALVQGRDDLVRNLIVGSVLSYSLLVLGGSFLYASFGKKDVAYTRRLSGVMTTLLMVVAFLLVIPTIMVFAGSPQVYSEDDTVLVLSHGVAVILFLLFCVYLVFRFITHPHVFERDRTVRRIATLSSPGSLNMDVAPMVMTLLMSSACVVFCVRYVLLSLDGTARALGVTTSFIGLVILPMVGNFGKGVRVIRRSRRNRNLNEPIRLIMTNIMDTLLFITPALVLLGWIMGRPMGLDLGLFESIVVLLAITTLTYLLDHGKTNYFEGCMLIGTYIVFVAAFMARPESPKDMQMMHIVRAEGWRI